jgi:hypothetical protein
LKTDPALSVGKGRQDRPFTSGSPEKGFLHLQKELVLALTGAGLRWGAVDMNKRSGDVMHFDMGDQKDPVTGDSYAAAVIKAKAQLPK